MSLCDRLDWARRRYFGTVEVRDPRPVADAAPYTFFLPSENQCLAVQEGDLVQLIVEGRPPSKKWDAERMWFTVLATDGPMLTGRLENLPFDMPQLRPGSTLRFRRDVIIDIDWATDRKVPPPTAPNRRSYWQRCLVDDVVLTGGALVHYLYREAPDLDAEGDTDPDSGWRIRGDYRGMSDAEVDARRAEYVAIGAVLNRDDSFIHLLDAPVGARYMRDWDTFGFIAED